jgi:AcrR family transcriptional regulator
MDTRREGDMLQKVSLRERQRREVREELQRTAQAMFLADGFDNVSVNDIAERVGVVERTFYRHFPTKEDAVLSLLDEVAPYVHKEVRNHPADDAPWRVLMDAMLAAQKHARSDADVMRMVFGTPKLLAAYYERQRQWAQTVAGVLAERLDVDAQEDPRPLLWAVLAFEIATQVSQENADAGTDVMPPAKLELRFRQAAEFFTGHLPT